MQQDACSQSLNLSTCSQREQGFERAYLAMDIQADLSSLFSWNTHQASAAASAGV